MKEVKYNCNLAEKCDALLKAISCDCKNNLGLLLSIFGILIGLIGLPFVYNNIIKVQEQANTNMTTTQMNLASVQQDFENLKNKVFNINSYIYYVSDTRYKDYESELNKQIQKIEVIIEDQLQMGKKAIVKLSITDKTGKAENVSSERAQWRTLPSGLGVVKNNTFLPQVEGEGWIIATIDGFFDAKKIAIKPKTLP